MMWDGVMGDTHGIAPSEVVQTLQAFLAVAQQSCGSYPCEDPTVFLERGVNFSMKCIADCAGPT
jgi:hypothetical protein